MQIDSYINLVIKSILLSAVAVTSYTKKEEMSDRATNVYLARLAEKAERYEDILEPMTKTVKTYMTLTVEEKYLLSMAFKNVAAKRRASWKVISFIEKREEQQHSSPDNLETIRQYKDKVEKELKDLCNEMLTLINDYLLPAAILGQTRLFYYKMKADYLRYLCEILTGDIRKTTVEEALSAYKTTIEIATTRLSPGNSFRIGATLNFAIFYNDIMKNPKRACLMAEDAYHAALPEIDALPLEGRNASKMMLHTLKDCYVKWKKNLPESSSEESE